MERVVATGSLTLRVRVAARLCGHTGLVGPMADARPGAGRMLTAETLVSECVGRYITTPRGALRLTNLINSRSYADAWSAMTQWAARQYSMGNSFSIPPIGVFLQHSNASDTSMGGEPAFYFYRPFVDKYGLELRDGQTILEKDVASAVKMYPSALLKYSALSDDTLRIALSHLFQRLGEVIAGRHQCIIDFGFASLVAEDRKVDLLVHSADADRTSAEKALAEERAKLALEHRQKRAKYSYLGSKSQVGLSSLAERVGMHAQQPGGEMSPEGFRALRHGNLSTRAVPRRSGSPTSPSRLRVGARSPSPPRIRDLPQQHQELYPPLLDNFSRTRSATFTNGHADISLSAKVAGFYTPEVGRWTMSSNRLSRARVRSDPVEQTTKPALRSVTIDDTSSGPSDITESQRRFNHYVEHGVGVEDLVPIKRTWVDNVLRLLNMDVSAVQQARIEARLAEMLAEMRKDYELSGRRAILDYVLRSPQERSRLDIADPPPRAVVDWGRCKSQPCPPITWREPIQHAWVHLDKNLFTVNYAAVAIQKLWAQYENLSLVAVPPKSALPMSIQDYEAMQKAHIKDQLGNFSNNWMREVEDVFRGRLDKDAERSATFFESIAALMTNLLRSIVESSAKELHAFITRYIDVPDVQFATGTAPSILTVRAPTDHTVPPPVFNIKIVVQRRKIQFQTMPGEIEAALCRIFDAILVGLDGIPRIETKLFPLLENPKNLTFKVDDAKVLALRDDIVRVFRECVASAGNVVNLYDEYSYLLDESQRLSDYVTQTRTLDDFRERIQSFRSMTDDLENRTRAVVQCRLLSLDCAKINELLVSKLVECSKQILSYIATRNIEHNVVICDEFKTVAAILLKKPLNSKELVDLVRYSNTFKQTTLKRLMNDCAYAVEELRFLFECGHLVNDDVLSHIGSTFGWVHKFDAIIVEADAQLMAERRKMEGQFEDRKEKFNKLLESYAAQIADFAEFTDLKREVEFNTIIKNVRENLHAATEECKRIQEQDELLGIPVTQFNLLDQAKEQLTPYEDLWTLVSEFRQNHTQWVDGPVFSLNAEQVKSKCDTMWRTALKLSKQLTVSAGSVAVHIKTSLEAFKVHIPLVEVLCNPGLRPRHWAAISEIVGFDLRPDDHTSLTRFVDMGVAKSLDQLQMVSETASKEYSIEKTLDAMKKEWNPVLFAITSYRDTGTSILVGSGIEEIQTLLDDHIVKTQTMKGSSFAKAFEEQIREWESWLVTMQDVIDNWLQVQTTWLYLEPIFSSDDIMKQMPEEGNLFRQVDTAWRTIMSEVEITPQALAVSRIPNLLESLTSARAMLDKIQAGLNQYLETKRLFFPRFFFLSDNELLEILAETKDPTRVQPHLKKCFEGVSKLEFQENLDVTALFSPEGERLALTSTMNPKDANGAVERWLSDVETLMFASVKASVSNAMVAYANESREQWVLNWPGQVVLAVSQIFWTSLVEKAIAGNNGGMSGTLKAFLDESNEHLQKIVALVRGQLTRLQRRTLGALVVIDVHARDTLQALVKANVSQITDFEWTSQLRYYWFEDTVKVRIINSDLAYGFEYLGNSDRLVITPLTDRCYRTLMGAIQFNLGGAPEGPAGTGKTETVKDLAKAMAIQCVVFNCSDGLDYLAMSKFFKGLASSGAWSCFDEFNRIDLEVLSVVAQQVLSIQRAVAAKAHHFRFEGTEIRLRLSCNVFITMNPGYAGRSELPDNLKSLFRTVAMMVPNYEMIAEITLYSCGFVEARALARKIVATYKLCSEQLSSQDHYDYGMRAVKAVLTAAGNLKRLEPTEDENRLMLRSINDVNLPKFLSQDIPLFVGIIGDLFPGVARPVSDYSTLMPAIQANLAKRNLRPVPEFLEKILQLHEMIKVRHGLMLVGQPFSGKTSAIRVLAGALSDISAEPVELVTLNPKSITLNEIYGQFDPVSHEWKDGLLSVHFRRLAAAETEARKWVMFDGPVDTLWIENMNTVLDDNKKLCLMSGEIIQMSSTMNMIFEVADLAVASPATVSRCGMVFLEPQSLGVQPLIDSWQSAMPTEVLNATAFQNLVKRFIPTSLELVRRKCVEYSPTSDMNLATALLRMYKVLLTEATQHAPATPKDVEGYFVFALVWSIGASVDENGRALFNNHVREICSDPANSKSQHMRLPDKGSVYDYAWNAGGWVPWSSMMGSSSEFRIEANARIQEIIVPTIDSARYTILTQLFARARIPGLFVGPTGTGKSAYITKALAAMNKDAYAPLVISFSAQTSASQTREIIDAKLDRKRKGVYGPPGNRTCVIFIDDLNMPKPEQFGAQPPLELLRQFLDHGGWYDVGDASFRTMLDTTVVCAMGPPGGGRNPITSRLTRHFSHVTMTPFDDASLTTIFTAILHWHLGKGFASGVVGLVGAIVDATRALFKTATAELLPTPARSHYTFNLRDLASVIRGLCMSRADDFPDGMAFVRLWVHEVHRVFADRLIDDGDALKFLGWVRTTAESTLKVNFDACLARLDNNGDGVVDTLDEIRGLMYGHFMTKSSAGARPYQEVLDAVAMRNVFAAQLENYNQEFGSPMRLVLFRFALEHVSRISRVLKQPFGHALLVGVGGTGRQSLTRLAAYVAGYRLFQVEMNKTYGMNEWREDLKRVLRWAGEKQEPTVFLFTDSQIKKEAFLEDINGILNSGEVPNLFGVEERAEISTNLQPAYKRARREDGTPAQCMAFFTEMVRENLHLALCMSPVGDALRNRLRMFPSLVNCCTIDWFQKWPTNALESVAREFIADVDLPEATRASCVKLCVQFHQSTDDLAVRFHQELRRRYYVTPSSYLELITAFKSLLAERRRQIVSTKQRYEGGLQVLATTASQVKNMLQELEELRPVLIRTGVETDEMIVQVDKETRDAEQIRSLVKQEEIVANEKASAAKQIADECGADLAQAMPILEAAIAALNTLTKNDLVEVKAMKSPPAGVLVVMEAVCVMMNIPPTRSPDSTGKMVKDYWDPAKKKLLSDPKLLTTLSSYDKDNIPRDIIKKIATYIDNPLFDPASVKKASKAAFGLCSWVRAMYQYDEVANAIRPKRERLEQAKAEYAVVEKGLLAKQAELNTVETKLAGLNSTLSRMQQKKSDLEAQVDLCGKKLVRAQQLIGGLGGEKDRWTDAAHALGVQYANLTGDIILSAGVIAYLGAFTAAFRSSCTEEWANACRSLGLTCAERFSLAGALGDPVRIRQWTLDGLPNDAFSIDNAIIIDKARRWPLMIDPQGQANIWIKNMERERKLVICKLTDPDFGRRLEGAIQFGVPCLLENVGEELDPLLEPVLLKQTYRKGGIEMIKLGDAEVEYSDAFRFYITSKMRNPHYLPELSTKITLLNFMITPDGLEDQLLGLVVARERPELQTEKNRLIMQSAENRKKLKDIEDEILKILSSTQGSILDDESAIQVLSASKQVSNDIAEKQAISDKTEKEIDVARLGYKPVAVHSSILFFCIADLANIDPMYQYSLGWFIALFQKSITSSEPSPVLETRLQNLNDYCTYALYCAVCRSLFEKDKLLFSFLLAVNILRSAGKIRQDEWRFLLTGGIAVDSDGPASSNPCPDWLQDSVWSDLCRLSSSLPAFASLATTFGEYSADWKRVYDAFEPHQTHLPGELQTSLDSFQKMLILRCLRPDKVFPAVRDFVGDRLGQRFVEAPPFDLGAAFRDSDPTIPLMFILSPGSDPYSSLLKFAADNGFGTRLESISLGQGQGPLAASMIEVAQARGTWVILQNCHLAISWMPTLERIVETTTSTSTHADYRLWLTSYPSDRFPVSILQRGIKMTNEPPKGLRANLLGSYSRDPICDPEFFGGSNHQPQWMSMLYGLCFFHALVQERRMFGPLGWNIPYEFNESDLRISVRQLHMFVGRAESVDAIPFKAIQYLVGQCNYGGRVTDDWDRRTLTDILSRFVSPNVFARGTPLSESGVYLVPDAGDYTSYIEHVKGLPSVARPEAFGLHDNADITKERNETAQLFRSILQTQARTSSAGTKSKEEIVGAIAADILSKVPTPFDLDKVQERFPVTYKESMNTVLCQEVIRYNRLVAVVRSSLSDLQKALVGLVVMSADLEQIGDALFDGCVPRRWLAVSYPTLKPLSSYVSDLVARLNNFQKWVQTGSAPNVFWISGFFFTQSFLTGVLQNYSRRYTIPIDEISFDFEFVNRDPSDPSIVRPADGAYIHGLFLEAAQWDAQTNVLVESQPKVLFSLAPIIWLRPQRSVDIKPGAKYDCPVYKTTERRGTLSTTGHSTNFVMSIRLPTEQPSSHWVQRGVALITQLDV